MDEAVIQHHFDEVFSALQDRENFEIFTKQKTSRYPRIRKTLVKIVDPSKNDATTNLQCDSDITESSRNFYSKFINSSPKDDILPYRPASRYSQDTTCAYRDSNSSNKTSAVSSDQQYSTLVDPNTENRKKLFECSYCGRYILGEFVKCHEKYCKSQH